MKVIIFLKNMLTKTKIFFYSLYYMRKKWKLISHIIGKRIKNTQIAKFCRNSFFFRRRFIFSRRKRKKWRKEYFLIYKTWKTVFFWRIIYAVQKKGYWWKKYLSIIFSGDKMKIKKYKCNWKSTDAKKCFFYTFFSTNFFLLHILLFFILFFFSFLL